MKSAMKLVCWILGHSKTPQFLPFFRTWGGSVQARAMGTPMETGTVHCGRCGSMLGDYTIDWQGNRRISQSWAQRTL